MVRKADNLYKDGGELCVPAGGGVGDIVAREEGGGGFRFVVLCGKFGQSAQRDRDMMRRFGWKKAKQLPRCDHRRLCLWVCGANGWVASTRCAICASRKAGGVGRNGCADCRVDCRDAGSRRNWADSAPWGRRGPIDEYHRPGRRLQRMRNLAIPCAELESAFRSIVDDAPRCLDSGRKMRWWVAGTMRCDARGQNGEG
jgi:hypothetical protein